jgi:predicted ABC-type ATPase
VKSAELPGVAEGCSTASGAMWQTPLPVDTELLESARDAGYTTKVVFISTEDPNLNVGSILVRMSHGGQSVPLNTIPESYEQSMKSLLEARKHANDVLVYVTRNSPNWLKRVFGHELGYEGKHQEELVRGR